MQHTVVGFILLLSLVAAQCATVRAGDDGCFSKTFSYDAQPNPRMPTCCWYSAATCCARSNSSAPQVLDLEYTYGYFERMVATARENDIPLNIHVEKCFNFIADFACLMCAPDTSSFIEREGEKLHVSLCSGWCADFHRACAKTPYFGNVGDDEADMCEYAISLWNREDAFDIISETAWCFEGVGAEAVARAECTPFDFVESAEEEVPPANRDVESNLLLFIVGGVVGVLSVVVVAAIVAVLVYVAVKRMKGTATSEYRQVTSDVEDDGREREEELSRSNDDGGGEDDHSERLLGRVVEFPSDGDPQSSFAEDSSSLDL